MVAFALTALPLIAEAGQGLVKAVRQDISGFLGASPSSSTGQNVPGQASSTPPTLAGAAQALSADVLNVLNTAQTSLTDPSSVANGQTGGDPPQLAGGGSGGAAGLLGQGRSQAAAKYQAADNLVNGVLQNATGLLNLPTGLTA